MQEIPEESKTALNTLNRLGVQRYQTNRRELSCGCYVEGGFRTDNYEPYLALSNCSPPHLDAVQRAHDRYFDPDSYERFDGVSSIEAGFILLQEEVQLKPEGK